MKYALLSILILFCLSCSNESEEKEVKQESVKVTMLKKVEMTDKEARKQIIHTFDTSVNGIFNLLDNGWKSKFKGAEVSYIETLREYYVVLFINKAKSEYLMAYQYEGGVIYCYDFFEIGYLFKDYKKYKFIQTNESSFITGTGIKLGMSYNSIKNKKIFKSENYKSQNDSTITFHDTDYKNSLFLKRYAMPGYSFECKFHKNKLVNIKFGFDYP